MEVARFAVEMTCRRSDNLQSLRRHSLERPLPPCAQFLIVRPQVPKLLTATGGHAVGEDQSQPLAASHGGDPAPGNPPLVDDFAGLLLKVGRHFAARHSQRSLSNTNLENRLRRQGLPGANHDNRQDQDFHQLAHDSASVLQKKLTGQNLPAVGAVLAYWKAAYTTTAVIPRKNRPQATNPACMKRPGRNGGGSNVRLTANV